MAETVSVKIEAIDGVTSELRKIRSSMDGQFRGMEKRGQKLNKSLSSIKGSFVALKGFVAAGIFAKFITETVKTQTEVQALRLRMQAAVGEFSNAGSEINRVRELSARMGLEFKSTANAFAGFSASALRSGLTLGETRQIFDDVSAAAVSMQLPTEQASRVFVALQQIASKGKVSMEELRQQLGESLPGAVNIAAASMGMTSAAFQKAVASGKIMSDEFLPKFAARIKKDLGGSAESASKSLQANLNRAKNVMFDLRVAVAEKVAPGINKALMKIVDNADRLRFNVLRAVDKATGGFNILVGSISLVGNAAKSVFLQVIHTVSSFVDAFLSQVHKLQSIAATVDSKLHFSKAKRAEARKDAEEHAKLAEIFGERAGESFKKAEEASLEFRNKGLQNILKIEQGMARIASKFEDSSSPEESTSGGGLVSSGGSVSGGSSGGSGSASDALSQIRLESDLKINAMKEFNTAAAEAEREFTQMQMSEFEIRRASSLEQYEARIEMFRGNTKLMEQAKTIHEKNLTAIEADETQARMRLKGREYDAQAQFARSGLKLLDESLKGNKKAAKARKAIAVTDSVIQMVAAGAKALNNPYPANLFFMAQVLATGAGLIATLKSQSFATGGIVEGSETGDRVPIRANGGEMVLTRQQQAQLYSLANGNAPSGGASINITQNIGSGADRQALSESNEMLLAQLREMQFNGQLAEGVVQ